MFKSDNLLENIAGPAAGNSHQIGQKTGPNTSEHFSLQGGRSIHRHHLQNFLGRDGREFSLKRAHLVKQAQALITRETVSAEANVQVKRTQTFELKAAVTKVIMTARRMHNVKVTCRSFQQLEIALSQFIQMRGDPFPRGATAGRADK